MSYVGRERLFSEERLEKRREWHWRMNPAWGAVQSEPTVLSELWRAARAGACSILPVLGQSAHNRRSGGYNLSMQEVAVLAGVDPETARNGARILEDRKLVKTSLGHRYKNTVTVWDLQADLAAPRGSKEYFYFSSSLLYGQNWARMSAPQRQLYLVLGANACTYKSRKRFDNYLNAMLPDEVDQWDLKKAPQSAERGEYLRLASISKPDLERASGLRASTISKAIAGFKHPKIWASAEPDAESVEHMPVWVYPSRGNGTLIYHLRDHVAPWPSEDATEKARGESFGIRPDSDGTFVDSGDESDDLPF